MLVDRYIKELSKLDRLELSIDMDDNITIGFENLVIKDGCAIKGVVGRGTYLYDAVTNFIEQINGQLLVNEKNRDIQYKVLIITKEGK